MNVILPCLQHNFDIHMEYIYDMGTDRIAFISNSEQVVSGEGILKFTI